MGKARKKVIVFSALVFLLALLLFGLLLSAFFSSSGVFNSEPVSPGLYQRSDLPGLKYEHVPGAKGKISGQEVRFNSLGFRGPEMQAQKPRGSLRIVVLGDSVVFGQGVKEEETLPAQLTKLLKAKAPEKRWEVINAGVRGYNISEYRVFLQHRLLPLEPDLLLLVLTEINDPEQTPFQPQSEKLLQLKNSPWIRIPFVRLLLAPAYAREVNRLFLEHVRELYDPQGPTWKQFVRELTIIQETCQARKISLIVVSFPFLSAENPLAGERDRLQDTFLKLGLNWVDPWPVLAGYPGKRLVVSSRDFHPNAFALGLTAELLVDPVLQQLESQGKISP